MYFKDDASMSYYRRNLYILCTTIFLSTVSWNQIVPFLPLFIKQMGITSEQVLLRWVGVIFALQSIAGIFAFAFWGKMGDKHGRKPMTVRAGLCLAAIYFGMSFTTAPWQVALCRLLNGALTGFVPGSMALIATNTPTDEAPRYMATAQTVSAAGLIAGPLIGVALAGLVGYRGSMRVSAVAVLISTILVAWLVDERKKVDVAEPTSLFQDFAMSFRSPILASILVTIMLYGFFVAAVNPILALHVSSIGPHAPAWLTGAEFALPAIAMVLFAHMWTRFGERRGYDKGIMLGLAGAAVCALLLTIVRNIWAFSAIFFVAGIFLAALNPSAAALIAVRVKDGFKGRAYGMQTSASTVGSFIAPLAATRLAAVYGIPWVFTLIGTALFAGSMIFFSLVRKWGAESDGGDIINLAL